MQCGDSATKKKQNTNTKDNKMNKTELIEKAQTLVANATDEQLDELWNTKGLGVRIRKMISAEMTRRVEESITEQDILDEMEN